MSDLDATIGFFVETLGWKLLGRNDRYPAGFVSDGTVMVTLRRVTDPATAMPFDRKANVGLHHLSLSVPSEEILYDLHARLRDTSDVRIETPPEPMGSGPTQHMFVFEPSGNRIEFTARP